MKGNFETLQNDELDKKRNEIKAEIRQIRFELSLAGSTANTKRIRDAKKDIARINTVLRAREIEAQKAAKAEAKA